LVADLNALTTLAFSFAQTELVGRLSSDAKGVIVTGPGKLSGRAIWVPIKHDALSGWVNQNFLFKEAATQTSRVLNPRCI
jgi:hypothetical protein